MAAAGVLVDLLARYWSAGAGAMVIMVPCRLLSAAGATAIMHVRHCSAAVLARHWTAYTCAMVIMTLRRLLAAAGVMVIMLACRWSAAAGAVLNILARNRLADKGVLAELSMV